MKKTLLFVAAVLVMSSCSLLKGNSSSPAQSAAPATTTTSTEANATVQGANAGTALLALYKQYQIDGKFNANNLQNIANTATLLANCSELKANVHNSDYLKQFGAGLMKGATNLVNTSNVGSVTDALTKVVTAAGQSDAANKATETVNNAASTAAGYAETAAQYASTAASAASSINSLLSLFGKK